MRFNHALSPLSMALAAVSVASAAVTKASGISAYSFTPEADKSYWKSGIPILFNFSTSQFENTVNGNAAATSYWTSSFLTGHNKRQYFILSHAFSDAENSAYYRSSVLDLGDLKGYQSMITYFNGTIVQSDSSLLKINIGQNGFESISDDNVSQMHTWSNHGNVTFDVQYNATSGAIVDGGAGLFTFGTGLTYEWGLPACRTEGSLTVNGEVITVDPTNSFTWYDRQWNDGVPVGGNWTWFELHVANSRTKISLWAIEDKANNQLDYFATIRLEDGSQNVVPVNFVPDYTRQWHSPATGRVYAQDWSVLVGDSINLRVSSVTGDQEIAGNTAFTTAYEGFVTFTGDVSGQDVHGYGAVEVVYLS